MGIGSFRIVANNILLIQGNPQTGKLKISQFASFHLNSGTESLLIKGNGPLQIGYGKAQMINSLNIHVAPDTSINLRIYPYYGIFCAKNNRSAASSRTFFWANA
jgi:hypothetical protein